MKKLFIISISILSLILLFNTNKSYAAAGAIYTDITQYIGSDINSVNNVYVANLAREYIIANQDSIITTEGFELNKEMFNNCVITKKSGVEAFSITFNNTGFTKVVNGSNSYIIADLHLLEIFLGCEEINIFYRSSNLFLKNANITMTYSELSKQTYYSSLDVYRNGSSDVIGQARNMNYNYNYVIEEVPNLAYNVYNHSLGYEIHITPYNISYPYDLKAYYSPDFTTDNPFILESIQTVQLTSKFIVPKDTSRVLIVCEHQNGALSLEINLNGQLIGDSGISGSTEDSTDSESPDSFFGNEPYLKASSIFNPEYWSTIVKTYNFKDGYKLYYSYDGGVTLNDMNYTYGVEEYQLTTLNGESDRVLFLVEDETGIFYTLDHRFYDTSYNGDGTYNGLFGEIENEIDINNFDVNDGISALKGFFNNVKEVFSMIGSFISFLPNWITVPLSSLLILIIIITVIKFIRG